MTGYPIPPRALAWLKNSETIRYLHRFDRSCNLLNQNDELLSFVLPSIGLGPFSLIVPEKVVHTLTNGTSVQLIEGQWLVVDGQKLKLPQETAVWNPVPDWSKLQNKAFDLQGVLPLPERIQALLEILMLYLRNNDEHQIFQVTLKLAGLGEGLTPIGDDVLMGVIFGLWVDRPKSPMISLIGNTAVPRTTTLSGAFLKTAVAGEATIHWHELANDKPSAKQKILSIGHTSGAAAWTGFVKTLELKRKEV